MKKTLIFLFILTSCFYMADTVGSTTILDTLQTPIPKIAGGNGDNSQTGSEIILSRKDPNTLDSKFTGVVSIEVNIGGVTYKGTGTLIDDRHVVTAAHVVDAGGGKEVDLLAPGNSVGVHFNHDGDNAAILSASRIDIHPDFKGFENGIVDDLAVITLSEDAPQGAERYNFYNGTLKDSDFSWQTNPVDGSQFTFVGYGQPGDGYWGYYNADFTSQGGPAPIYSTYVDKLVGGNIIDFIFEDEDTLLPQWWLADFDGHDAVFGDIDLFGVTYDKYSSWLDEGIETTICSGDSGGPSFIYDNALDVYLLAGVNTMAYPDENLSWREGAFGETLGGMVLSDLYTGWINQVVEYPYSGAPLSATPEPATMLLFGLGLLGFAGINRRKNNVSIQRR